jgi:hypothetical protein
MTIPTPTPMSEADDRAALEVVAQWMLAHSFATGHGDTLQDLLGELSWQVTELRNGLAAAEAEVAKMREAAQAVYDIYARGGTYEDADDFTRQAHAALDKLRAALSGPAKEGD